jgi:glucose dehydrogenase
MWNWWTTRNKVNVEGNSYKREHVADQVRKSAAEFREFFMYGQTNRVQTTQNWHPPPPDTQKFLHDGSFFAESRCGGWGFIIHDSDGDTVWSGAGGVAHAQDALQAEAEACIQAMPVAHQYGMTKFIIETDAQKLVQAVR